MSAVQLETPVEGQFLQITPEKKLRFTAGAWRLHTNNLPVSEIAPVPALPPERSEEAPALPFKNPFWQQLSTGKLYFQYKDTNNVVSWKPVSEEQLPVFTVVSEAEPALPNDVPFWQKASTGVLHFQHTDAENVVTWKPVATDAELVLPLVSETEPALPNPNPFWQKPSNNQLYYQYQTGGGDIVWRPVQNTDRYDLSVFETTSVLDFAVNQVFKVDNTTASVKSLVVQNAPSGRAITVPVIIMGKVGTVNFPAGVNWDQNKVPTLSDTKTTIIFMWDGTSLTGSKGHSY